MGASKKCKQKCHVCPDHVDACLKARQRGIQGVPQKTLSLMMPCLSRSGLSKTLCASVFLLACSPFLDTGLPLFADASSHDGTSLYRRYVEPGQVSTTVRLGERLLGMRRSSSPTPSQAPSPPEGALRATRKRKTPCSTGATLFKVEFDTTGENKTRGACVHPDELEEVDNEENLTITVECGDDGTTWSRTVAFDKVASEPSEDERKVSVGESRDQPLSPPFQPFSFPLPFSRLPCLPLPRVPAFPPSWTSFELHTFPPLTRALP